MEKKIHENNKHSNRIDICKQNILNKHFFYFLKQKTENVVKCCDFCNFCQSFIINNQAMPMGDRF